MQATNRGQLAAALREADATEGFVLIECVVPPADISPVSRRYIRASIRKGKGSQAR